MPLNCVVVGSINVDWVCGVQQLPRPGETVLGGVLESVPGGKGANQAVAAARWGATVSMIGAVGDDAEGALAVANLREQGVSVRGVQQVASRTGVAMIAVSSEGENLIIVAPGANQHLTVNAQDLHGADVVLLQREIPEASQHQAATLARAQGAFVCLNVAPAGPIAPDLLQACDLVVANEAEAAALPDTATIGLLAVSQGSHGAQLWRYGQLVASSPVPPVTAVDTVGAGDTFVAVLALSLAAGLLDGQALRWACAAGSLACTQPGAQTAIPTRMQTENLGWV